MSKNYSFLIVVMQNVYNLVVFKIARIRALFWGIFMKRVGRGVYIMEACKILNPTGIEIGDYSGINHHTDIGGRGGLKIGNYVMIGPYCQIITALHKVNDWKKPISEQGIYCNEVIIEDDVWIGTHVVILPKVKIGRGAVIGAGAVVTSDVAPYSIVGGVPAKLIKYRFPKEMTQKAIKVDFNK